jgi:hypothetical protein
VDDREADGLGDSEVRGAYVDLQLLHHATTKSARFAGE